MDYQWKWVDWAWAQYGNLPRMGEVTSFRDRQLARADELHLCVVFGLNLINGGDGSSGKGVPRRHLMTGAEFLRYYSALLPYTPLAFHWQYRAEVEGDPTLRAAMQQVRAMADTMPRPSCRYEQPT
jgi:hypothetical protein